MNFYKRFVGDIQKKTGGLSCAAMGVYDRLLDHCYGTECPLEDFEECCRVARAMTKEERQAVTYVLKKFFTKGDDGCYRQERTEEMIAEAQPKIEAAKRNGKKGGRPKKNPTGTQEKPTGLSNGNPTGTQGVTQTADSAKASQNQSSSSNEELDPPAGVRGAKRSAKRCPAAFEPPPDVAALMAAECPGVDLDRELAKMRDWEFERAKSDWVAVYRTWMRKAFERLPRNVTQLSFAERDAAAKRALWTAHTGGRYPSGDILDMEAPDAPLLSRG